MNITFDFNKPSEVRMVHNMIELHRSGALSGDVKESTDKPVDPGHVPEAAMAEPVASGEATKADPKIGVETDSRGVPWLADAHATTKGKNNDGTWKKKRGVDAETIAKLEQAALDDLAGTPEPSIPAADIPAPDEAPMDVVTMQDVVDIYKQATGAGIMGPTDMHKLYASFNTNPADLETNETARRGIRDHIEALFTPPTTPGLPDSGLPA